MKTSQTILHLDLDTFFVSVERLQNSKLEGKPVLIGGLSDRGVVASCSYEARRFGVHSAMPMKLARQLCPDAEIIKGDSGLYSKYSHMVTDVVKEQAPIYEKASIDEFYLDATGMDRFFGTYKWASELRQRIIKETGLPISFGMSTNKTVAKISTGEAKPNGQIYIVSGKEKGFLAPLPVRKIPMVGEKTTHLLHRMGVKYIYTVQEMPREMLEGALGKPGLTLWNKAQGIDPTPVIPYVERKSISLERTFEKDTIDVFKLKSILVAMVEELAFQLRHGERLTSCVTVKIRYADFNTYSKQKRVPYSSADHVLIEVVRQLFEALFDRRQLIRLIGVRFSHLVQGSYQIDLFDDTEKMVSLYEAMDKMKNRFGHEAVKRAVGMKTKNFRRGNPFNGEPPVIPAHRRS
ncbi:MAG: DNA polymerase-4 [Psychroserpens sp.]